MIKEFLLVGLGFFCLVGGAEWLIRGATSVARLLGVSTLMIGLTVVAFGTSAPELFVSMQAAVLGTADMAVGNVIGSNIFNVLIIIGLSALITPIYAPRAVVVREMPLMLGVLGLFWWFGADLFYSRMEGAVLFGGIFAYLGFSYVLAKRRKAVSALDIDDFAPDDAGEMSTRKSAVFVIAGLAGMVLGAHWIVENAVVIAKYYHVSDLIIGVTLVAVGTSLPELATTVVAARNGQSDLAVGNAIGSNLFNVLCVIGLTSLVSPLPVSQAAVKFDFPFMFFSCLIAWPLMKFGGRLSRKEGGFLVATYVAYIAAVLMFQTEG